MRDILTFLLILLTLTAVGAQERQVSELPDTLKPQREASAWTLIQPLGLRERAQFDTLTYNYQRQAIPSLVSDAYASTGNLGCAGRNELFMQRPERRTFFFADALDAWLPGKQKFYNVYIPFTQVSFNTGGNKQNTQDRLRVDFAGNANRRVGVGAMLDYLYSKGMYQAQSSKDFTFGFSGYYSGDRYQMQAYYTHYNLLNKENGGITDPLYITDPAQLQGGVSKIEPRSIPVNLTAAHSRISGQHLLLNQAYNVGYWREQVVNDTLTREVYVPVTKFIWTLDFVSTKHKFINDNAQESADFWQNAYFNASSTRDVAYYSDFSNTVGISLIEGFRDWAKFGLAAYAAFSLRHYSVGTMLSDGTQGSSPVGSVEGLTPIPENIALIGKQNQGLLWAGAQLTKQRGALLTYEADFRMGLTGEVAADLELSGRARSRFRLLGDTVQVMAHARFYNKAQPWLMQHYFSNHFVWDNDFGKTRSLKIGGELFIPWTRTTVSADVENIQNYVYFSSAGLPLQEGGSTQVFSVRLLQQLAFGIWHWDNTVTYQTSSRSDVIPLPQLAVYSNMYLQFRAFRVLNVQIGVDCDWYTRYYAPSYQPATMVFTNQQETKIGNYPFMNLYATCRLHKVRFFVLWSHVNQNLFSHEAFSMPLYPLNPRRLQIGLSVDFTN